MKKKHFSWIILLIIILQAPGSNLTEKVRITHSTPQISSQGKYMRTLLNVNNFTSWFYATGTSANDPNGDVGGIFPRGTAGVIFTDGLVWGGFVDDTIQTLRVGGVTYNEGIQQGRILPSGEAQDPNHPEARIYRIHRNYQHLSENYLRRDAAEQLLKDETEVEQTEIDAIRRQYEIDWQEWPAHLGAPFYDTNNNGIYEPQLGESPGLANADQVIWAVYNDLNEGKTVGLYGSQPIGMELQVTAWAYESPERALNNTLFRTYRLINKGRYIIDSMFVGLWSDVDIGNYTDDFVGYDSGLGLGYAYSSTGSDKDYREYGLYSPAIGYTIINEISMPVTSFGYVHPRPYQDVPLGDYDGTLRYYNSLNGFMHTADINNPTPYSYQSGPDKGKITKFPFSGDPITGSGDIDGQGDNRKPGDRRILLSTGPVTFTPGDTLELVEARVCAPGSPYHPYAVEWLKKNVRQIKAQYPNFITQDRLPTPQLDAVAVNGAIHIDWGHNQDLIYDTEQKPTGSSYKFEGYNIWQLPGADASLETAVRIATIDLPSPPRLITGYAYDESSGILTEQALAFGTNSGIQRFLNVTRDTINQQNFSDGQAYHFAVTAYYYSDIDDLPFPVIESKPGRISLRAQADNPGYSISSGEILSVIHTSLSHGDVKPIVVNPAMVTGHSYQVSFTDSKHWSVTDITDGVIMAENQSNLSGDFNYPIIDGILPVVTGPEYTHLSGWDYDGNRWVSGHNWGGQEFFGGLDIGHRFLGSILDSTELVPVRLEFQDQADVDLSGYLSEGAVYRRDQDYAYAGTGNLPFSAYDVSDPDNPRRLNICFCEQDDAELYIANYIWDMGWNGNEFPGSSEEGAHEYIFIMNSSYDGGQEYNDTNNGTRSDVLFAIWPKNRGSHQYLEALFTMNIEVDLANTPQDVFTFTAPAPADIPNRFQVYHNYPNPFNNSTTIRYWLPEKSLTTLQIYDILGRKVATPINQIQEQGEYFFQWQPANIASGVYFYMLISGKYSQLFKMAYIK